MTQSGQRLVYCTCPHSGASLDESLLQIELELELPEAMKPRRIDIKTGKSVGQADKVRTIEHSKVA